MDKSIERVMEAIASDILTLSSRVLESNKVGKNSKTNQNTLLDSSMYRNIQSMDAKMLIGPSGDSIVLDALFENYNSYVEWDRPKKYGKKPPIDSLRDWAASRGIPTDNNTLWAISTAIWRDGHEGRPVMAVLEQEIEHYMENEASEKLADIVMEEITKIFN